MPSLKIDARPPIPTNSGSVVQAKDRTSSASESGEPRTGSHARTQTSESYFTNAIEQPKPVTLQGGLPSQFPDGVVWRVGPGQYQYPTPFSAAVEPGVHRKSHSVPSPVDGHGIVYKLGFHNGGVTYQSRFVNSLYRQNEELAGRPLFPSYSYRPDLLDIFSTKDPRPFFQALLGALSLKGTYNTGVLPLGDRVVPLVEDHAASYALDADTLETLRHSGVSKIPGIGPESLTYMRQTITAHPKLDPQTGRRFLYGVIPAEAPFMGLRLNTVTDSGELEFKGFVKPSRGRFIFPKPPGTDHLAEPLKALGIELGAGFGMSYFPQPHDIAVAGDMLCVPMHPIGANMADLVSVGPADGLFWDKGSPSELVFIDHHTFEEKLRVEISPPIAAFHWPWGRVLENGQIELVTVEHEDLDAALGHGLERQLNDSQNGANIGGKLIRLSIDPKTRRVEKTVLSDSPVELPVTDRRFEGDNSNSLYCVAALDNARAMNAIQRFDITRTSGGPFQTWQAPEGHIVSEPTFVPAKESTRRGHGDAPGFLVTVVHHQDGGRPGSYVAILDAEQVDRGPVARFDLPHAVPFGLHTAFQKASLDEAR